LTKFFGIAQAITGAVSMAVPEAEFVDAGLGIIAGVYDTFKEDPKASPEELYVHTYRINPLRTAAPILMFKFLGFTTVLRAHLKDSVKPLLQCKTRSMDWPIKRLGKFPVMSQDINIAM
jgi:hypothetical protein